MSKSRIIWVLALLLVGQMAWSQTKTVAGKVTDEKNSPLSGVTISANNQVVGVSENDGSFAVVVPQNTAALVISYVGFNSQTISITGSFLAIKLESANNQSLDEVVVVGYGTKLKRDLTGNIARVKGAEIANTPVSNFNQALQGRAAGVFVEANNGKVGEGVKVRIRGAGSISASNDPLYVVDGVPINTGGLSGNALADINFNDVESFEILKDASAAAIYGSRAANGVVLITTKRGRAGKTNLSVNMQYGINKPTGYRGFLDAGEYVELLREAAYNSDLIDGYDPINNPGDYPGSWLEFAENRMTRYSGYSDWRTLETNTDWEKLAFNSNAANRMIDMNASGGNDKTRFYISGGLADQDGILVGNSFQRISARMNLEHDASAKLRIGFNMGLSRTLSTRNPDDNQFSTPMQLVALAPITPVRDLNGQLYDRPVTTYYNGLIELEDSRYTSTTYRNLGSAFLQYKFFNGFSFRSEYGIDIQTQNDDIYNGTRTITGGSTNGYGRSDWSRTVTYNTNNYFSYNKNIGSNQSIDATLGMSFQKFNNDFTRVTGEDFPVDALKKIASAGRITGGSSTATESSILSYFARANYKLNDKYLLSLSGRVDGSSRFGKENKYGFFPAASAGWIISEESFLANSNTISFLKLRASYGLTGNDAGFGDFAQLGLWGAAKYAGTSGLAPTQLANPELRWEKSAQTDIGIDFGLLNNRLTGEIDFYVRNTKDLIYNVPVPGTSGFATQTVNVGSMQNKGVEFVLNSLNVNGVDFKWNSSLNISRNRNKITQLDGSQTIIPGNDGRYLNSLLVGEGIGVFYGPKYAGVDPDNGDALYFEADGKTTTNDIDAAGSFVVGDPNPDWIAGLQNSFTYKGFQLDVLFQGVFGNQILNGAGGFMSASFDWFDNQTRDQLRRWQQPGDITDVPQLRLAGGNGIGASSRYVEDGSYVRLKTITFSYSVNGSWLRKARIQSARLFVTGVNLLTFTDYTGWDPEVNTDYRAGNRNQGSDFYAAPQIKSLTFGLNLGF